jgi:twitching motility protein PilT
MARIDNLLKYAASIGASDVHLAPAAAPMLRLHGQLKQVKGNVYPPQETASLIEEILSLSQKEHFAKHPDLDFCYDAPGIGRFRTNILRQRKGYQAVFRVIPPQPPKLESLGFPELVSGLTRYHQGLILVTGPSGCGKSTTLAAMIDHINQHEKVHIITVEDPIEYAHSNRLATVTQRQVKRDTENFSSALRAALREDPDVILIGEMRDLETVSMAITAAETGHLVFGTLHTRNAGKTVDRIIDAFPPSQQNQIRAMVSESLRAVVCQQLLPRADGKGRVPAYEILLGNLAISNLIRDGKTFQIPSVMQIATKEGMILMDQCLSKLVSSKTITYEQAILRAENKKAIARV